MTFNIGISKTTGSSSDEGFLLYHNMAEAFRWRYGACVLAWASALRWSDRARVLASYQTVNAVMSALLS